MQTSELFRVGSGTMNILDQIRVTLVAAAAFSEVLAVSHLLALQEVVTLRPSDQFGYPEHV